MVTPKKSLRQLALEARQRSNMTQAQFSDRTGIAAQYLSNYEGGRNAPKGANLQRYVKFCGDMKWADLVEGFSEYLPGAKTSRGGALSHELKFALSFEDWAALDGEARRRGLSSVKMLVLDLIDRVRTGKGLQDIGTLSPQEEMVLRAVLNIIRQVPGLPNYHVNMRQFLEGLGQEYSESLHSANNR